MIPHSKPSISLKEIKAVTMVLKSGYLAQGAVTQKFEQALARRVATRHACALNSGTSALHLALLALKIKSGDELIIPSYVCTALLNAVLYTGATPRVVDINPDDCNICPIAVEEALNKKTRAIIVPHMFGIAADLDELLAFGVPVIEDCALSIGALYKGKPIGSFGAASVFSFYATKVITTAQGGALATNDNTIADFIREKREYDNKDAYELRYNYAMSDMAASLGLEQLKRLPQFISRRQTIAAVYNKSFAGLALELPSAPAGKTHIYFRYLIKVKQNASQFIRQLQKAGIEAKRPVYKPLHRYLGLSDRDFPSTMDVYREAVSLPIYPDLLDSQIARVARVVKRVIKG